MQRGNVINVNSISLRESIEPRDVNGNNNNNNLYSMPEVERGNVTRRTESLIS